MSGFFGGVGKKLGPSAFFKGGIPTPPPPPGGSRWVAVVTDPTPIVSGHYALVAGDDGKLFVSQSGDFNDMRISDALPVGFSFGFIVMVNGDNSIDSASGADHIYDENGDQTNAYGTTANPGGMFVELMKVAANEWQVIDKTGNWAAT